MTQGVHETAAPPREVSSLEAGTDDVSMLTQETPTVIGRVTSSIGSVIYYPIGYLMRTTYTDENETAVPDKVMPAEIPEGSESQEPALPNRTVAKNKIDFLQDPRRQMTWGRRIGLALMHKKWYNPHAENLHLIRSESENRALLQEARPPKRTREEKPSLERAWAYFEHFALPRFIVDEQSAKGDLSRAEPGEDENPTKLYDPICTPLSQMGDFGLGVGLYFSTLRAITVLTLVCGLLNIPNFIYFSGPDYSDNQNGVPRLLKGSAICTDEVWVPCADCSLENFTSSKERYGTAVNSNGDVLNFAIRNNCNGATTQQVMINYGTLILVLVGILAMNAYQKKKEIEFDEDEQTSQDYSIRIQNPPPDAVDPEEWFNFFHDNFEGAHATVITVALDNDLLVRDLVARREAMKKLELHVEPGTSLDTLTLARLAAETLRDRSLFQRLLAFIAPGIPEYFSKIAELEAQIKGWAQIEYPVSNVFVSFETEEAQRFVLNSLSLGSLEVSRNDSKALANAKFMFRRGRDDERILKVKEPEEPSTIRWADLNVTFADKMKPLATTSVASVAAIILIAVIIATINNKSTFFAAFAISISNSFFPMVAKALTNMERHSSEGLKQTSLYFKIAAFRWVNTAIVITLITPFTSTLANTKGLILSIYTIFFAELVTTNAIQLLDPVGHLQRHYLAPRASTQDLMNLSMQGQSFELAERYTNMTKILFLTLWYCSIYPGALFMCSFTLGVNYFTDRFSLMRTWKRIPQLGTRISKFSRRYFFSTAIVAMAVVSSYYWSGFPYDNLCENKDPVGNGYAGTWNVTTGDNKTNTNVTVSADDASFRFCLQDLLRTNGKNFPALAKFQPLNEEWMTVDQETVVTIYGWTSVGVMGIVCMSFLWAILLSVRSIFKGTYTPNGEDQAIGFSDVRSMSAFVPQVASDVFSYPLLACNSEAIDSSLYDWTDPDRPFSYYDLTIDAKELLEGLEGFDFASKHVFSIVSHRPPAPKDVDIKIE